MGAWLFLLFVLVPIVEIWLIGVVGHALGFLPTLLLLVASGAFGAWFAKREGVRVWREWQRALAEGRLPEAGVVDGLLVLVGGVLMVAPGFLTDLTGMLLVFPPTRALAARLVRRWFERRLASGSIRVVHMDTRPGPRDDGVVQGHVVDER